MLFQNQWAYLILSLSLHPVNSSLLCITETRCSYYIQNELNILTGTYIFGIDYYWNAYTISIPTLDIQQRLCTVQIFHLLFKCDQTWHTKSFVYIFNSQDPLFTPKHFHNAMQKSKTFYIRNTTTLTNIYMFVSGMRASSKEKIFQ